MAALATATMLCIHRVSRMLEHDIDRRGLSHVDPEVALGVSRTCLLALVLGGCTTPAPAKPAAVTVKVAASPSPPEPDVHAGACDPTGEPECFGPVTGPARCGSTLVASGTCCCGPADLRCVIACGKRPRTKAPSWLAPSPPREIADCRARCAAGHAPSCIRAGQSYVRSDLVRALDLHVRGCRLGFEEGCRTLRRLLVLEGSGAHRGARSLVADWCDGGEAPACRLVEACNLGD